MEKQTQLMYLPKKDVFTENNQRLESYTDIFTEWW